MQDDLWGDITQQERGHEARLVENERNKTNEVLTNKGYLDGLEVEENQIIESEFREGFQTGTHCFTLFSTYFKVFSIDKTYSCIYIGANQWREYSRLSGKIEALK